MPTESSSKDGAKTGPNVVEIGSAPKRPVAPKLTEAQWFALVEAFRTSPDPVVAAAKVGCDRRTAKKAWHLGMGSTYKFGQMPICEIVREEQALARAQLGVGEAPTVAELEQARQDAIRQRADQARMLRVAKGNLLGLLAISSKLVLGATDLAARMQAQLKDVKDPAIAMRLFKDIGTMVRAGVEGADICMKLERATLGNGPAAGPADQMSVEEAQRELKEAAGALDRAKGRWGEDAAVVRSKVETELDAIPEAVDPPNRIAEGLAELREINRRRLEAEASNHPGSASESGDDDPPDSED